MNTLNNRFKRLWWYLSNLAFLLLLLNSCNNKDDDFTIGNNFLESQTNITLIDTFIVGLSTIVLDSFPSHGESALVIGYYADSSVGKISCSSFFQIGMPTNVTLEEDDVYDSITLKMTYTGYTFGDTTREFSFSVHRLTATPVDSNYLYNTSNLSYEPEPLATYSLIPSPNSGELVEFRLDDALGEDLFEKMFNENDIFDSEDDFIEYFNGLALIPDSTSNNSIVNFMTASANLAIVLYIHRYDESDNEVAYEFPITYNGNQFNRIKHDFSGTGLESFVQQRYDVPSTLTGNKSYLFGGAGLFVKVRFPSLQELNYLSRGAILKTELIFYPDQYSAQDKSLPTEVILYETDKYNHFGDQILAADGLSAQVASFNPDEMYHENISYTFDITDFILSEFYDGYFNSDNGLILSLPAENFTTSFERLNVESLSPAPKLKIYYVSY